MVNEILIDNECLLERYVYKTGKNYYQVFFLKA